MKEMFKAWILCAIGAIIIVGIAKVADVIKPTQEVLECQ